MTLGAMAPTVNRTTYFTSAAPHLALSVHFACPLGVPYTSMRRILMPFSYAIWLYIIASILLVIFLLYLNRLIELQRQKWFKTNDGHMTSIFDVMGVFLGLPMAERTLRENAWLGLVLWLLLTFVLRNIYLGSLFNLLSSQIGEEPVDTIDRIIEHNFTVYCTPATYELLGKSMPHLKPQ